VCVCVAWGIQSGGVSSSIGFNLSLYFESRATPGISASFSIKQTKLYGDIKMKTQSNRIFALMEDFNCYLQFLTPLIQRKER
jgi:hypothetical protein